MKKHLYTLLIMAVALFSAVTLVSCSSDDNDNPGGGDKPVVNKINVYAAYISSDVFTLCDFSLTLHSGDKSKVVKLDKANGKLMDVVYMDDPILGKHTFPAYRFIFDNVDGNKGIDKVEASATLNPGVGEMVEAMTPEASFDCLITSAVIKAEFQPSGNYSFEGSVQTAIQKFGREGLLRDVDGKKGYETLPSLFADELSN